MQPVPWDDMRRSSARPSTCPHATEEGPKACAFPIVVADRSCLSCIHMTLLLDGFWLLIRDRSLCAVCCRSVFLHGCVLCARLVCPCFDFRDLISRSGTQRVAPPRRPRPPPPIPHTDRASPSPPSHHCSPDCALGPPRTALCRVRPPCHRVPAPPSLCAHLPVCALRCSLLFVSPLDGLCVVGA